MTIGAIGGCSDNASNGLRPDTAQRPGEEKLNPVEEANRLAEETRGFDPAKINDQRVNPTENAAEAGPTQNLAQAAEVNTLRDAGEAGDSADRGDPVGQRYQATEAGDDRFPNRGGVLDFQI